jgi:hypothetical protein
MAFDKNQKTKGSKNIKYKNIIESFKDIGSSTAKTLQQDVIRPQDILDQLMAFKEKSKDYSGEIAPGESLEMGEVYSGKREKDEKLQNQLNLERRLHEEEKIIVQEKTNSLKLQLNALMQEVSSLTQSTQELGQEVQIASMQAPVEPGVYHILFFEKLLDFIKSFRKKIEESSIWLSSLNKRAQKKNYWSMYKEKKGSFLLSPDHYLQRSAG